MPLSNLMFTRGAVMTESLNTKPIRWPISCSVESAQARNLCLLTLPVITAFPKGSFSNRKLANSFTLTIGREAMLSFCPSMMRYQPFSRCLTDWEWVGKVLNAIAAMKEMYLPLREIRHRLNTLTPEQMRDPAYLATLSQAVAMDRSMGRRHERNPRHDRSAQIGAAAARRMAHMESPRRSMAQREQVGSLSAPPMEDVSNTWERFPLGEDAELLIRSSKAKNMGPGLYRTLHRLRHMIENDRDDTERNRS